MATAEPAPCPPARGSGAIGQHSFFGIRSPLQLLVELFDDYQAAKVQ
ncbi:hypothetical protein [Pseudomonas kitaguniensis]